MGNICSNNEDKLLKQERDAIVYLLTDTETRLEFFEKLHELSQYNYRMNKTKIKQIFNLLRTVINNKDKYQDRFYSILFLYNLLRKYKKAESQFVHSQLREDIEITVDGKLRDLALTINIDSVKNWKERYQISVIELMTHLLKVNGARYNSFAKILNKYNISEDRQPFYTKLEFGMINNIIKEAGKLIRAKS